MSYTEHLSMLIAVIVGLAVTDMLGGASRTLRLKGQPGFTWLPFAQGVMLATIILVFWLAAYAELESGKYVSILAYTTQLIAPGLLYFAATRVFPPAEGTTSPDVRSYAAANARDVYIPPALWMIGTMAGNVYFFWPNWRGTLGPNALCLVAVVMLSIGAFARSNRIRWAITLLTEATLVTFIAIYIPSTTTG